MNDGAYAQMRPFLNRARDRVSIAVAHALRTATSALPSTPRISGFHAVRILGGVAAGQVLMLPTIQRLSYLLGTFEPHVSQTIREHVRPGSVAYDIGANVGYHTLALARCVGVDGQVLAVEPSPRDRQALTVTLRANRLTQVRILPSVLAEEPGTVQFATFGYSGVSHIAGDKEPADATIHAIPATTLDLLVFSEGYPPPAFIKMDVEGAELRILLGGTRVLASARPIIVCEVRWQTTYEPICQLLERLGYQHRILWRGTAIGDVLFAPC